MKRFMKKEKEEDIITRVLESGLPPILADMAAFWTNLPKFRKNTDFDALWTRLNTDSQAIFQLQGWLHHRVQLEALSANLHGLTDAILIAVWKLKPALLKEWGCDSGTYWKEMREKYHL
jgi:hypothetical protein